jgi:Zn-dependent protease/predicted transcriptional regulator
MSRRTSHTPGTEPNDSWSVQVARVSGIPIRLHFTFLLMLIYFSVVPSGGGGQVLFTLGLFFCVALHELGHSITAQRLGYNVQTITLYPIGGVAALEGNPRARHELWIALAGPAVNVVIVALLTTYFALATPQGLLERLQTLQFQRGGFTRTGDLLTLLALANISLALFNMVPAFPMDGGRVLRALLALRMPRERATRIAATVGQGIAVLAGLWALTAGQFSLMLIALFIFFGAGQERQVETERALVDQATVGEAMLTEFVSLVPGDTLADAGRALLATSQQDFPVVQGDDVIGLLSRDRLLRGLAQEGESAYVAGTMDRNVVFASPEDPLDDFLLSADGVRRAPVVVRGADGGMVGLVTLENVMEFLTLRRIARLRHAAPEVRRR